MKAAGKGGFFTYLLVLGIFTLLLVRCSPEKQFRILSYFFDGVPDPNQKTENTISTSTDTLAIALANKNAEPEFLVHAPYAENKCESCHEKGFSNSLILPIPELCFSCHEDFNDEYKTLHGPVATGYCTACHNPHMSKSENLLERTNQELCLHCHQSEQIFKGKMHLKIENKNCTDCHGAHGGENKAMLIAGTCYNCHENLNEKYPFLHGPVASGNCNACHSTHDSKSKNLLVTATQDLCYSCHNSEQVLKNPVHKKIKKNNCFECHNAHGGADRSILIQSLMPYKEGPSNKMLNKAGSDTLNAVKQGTEIQKDSSLKPADLPEEKIIPDSSGSLNYNNSLPDVHLRINIANNNSLSKSNKFFIRKKSKMTSKYINRFESI